ncbi:MAG: mucin-binding protein [Weissella confusa]
MIFKDDTMGGATLTRVDLGGYTDQQIDFADAQDVLGQYLAAGYQLVAEPKDPYLIDSKQTHSRCRRNESARKGTTTILCSP